ncbi:MAG: hypothetical protein QNK40_10995 [Desulfobacterales bacterium]|nr:hypothetical protein [Desulfobacterales bacterium]
MQRIFIGYHMRFDGISKKVCRGATQDSRYLPEDDSYLLEKEETSDLFEMYFEK